MTKIRRGPASRAAVLSIAFLVASAGLGEVVPVLPADAAVATPCASGAPIASDFDGDGTADLVVGGFSEWTWMVMARDQYIQPGKGGTGYVLTDTGDLRSADLNGDVCADAVLSYRGAHPWLKVALGTPDGIDAARAVDVPIPQSAQLTDQYRTLQFEAAILRHDGLTQLVLSGRRLWKEDTRAAFVDVFTLDEALSVTTSQVLEDQGLDGELVNFGRAIAASGRTVAVGVPAATVSRHRHAGAVRLYTVDDADPTRIVLRTTLTQASPGVPGGAEANDRFGWSLAMRDGRLAIGAPGESVGRITSAGAVQPLLWNEATGTYTAYRTITQDTSGVPDRSESQDHFGEHLAIARGLTAPGSYDVVIGAQESRGTLKNTGSVTVANFTKARYRTYTQATKGMPGIPLAGNDFSHVGVQQGSTGVDTILIGAPGEDVDDTRGVGRAVRSDGSTLGNSTTWTTIPLPDAVHGLFLWGWDFGAEG